MKNPCKPCRFKTYRDSCVYSSSTCNQYSIELDIQVTKITQVEAVLKALFEYKHHFSYLPDAAQAR